MFDFMYLLAQKSSNFDGFMRYLLFGATNKISRDNVVKPDKYNAVFLLHLSKIALRVTHMYPDANHTYKYKFPKSPRTGWL